MGSAAGFLAFVVLVAAGHASAETSHSAYKVDGEALGFGPTEDLGSSGFLPTDATPRAHKLFFWSFPPRGNATVACVPLILWLQGGPGASSIGAGLLVENGPLYLETPTKLRWRTNSWNMRYAMLFVDQPAGTGYSRVGTTPAQLVTSSSEAAEQLYFALQQWLDIFPEYRCSPLYIAGESYGGHYVPHTSAVIHERNAALGARDAGRHINLVGLMIGNPDLDQASQMPPVPDLLYNMGLLNAAQTRVAAAVHKEVVDLLEEGRLQQSFTVWNRFWGDCCPCPGCEDGTYTYLNMTGLRNPLDIRTSATLPSWGFASSFLNNATVKSALHVPVNRTWVSQNNDVYMAMANSGDAQNASLPLLPGLMAHYKVLLYTGQMDATLGPVCLQAAVQKLMTTLVDIPGAEAWAAEWDAAQKIIWRIDDNVGPPFPGPDNADTCGRVHDVAGYIQSIQTSPARNFTLATILNAGHLAPGNQPLSAMAMITHFVDGIPFG